MAVEIVYLREDLIPSLHQALDSVAREEIYVEKIVAPELADFESFHHKLVAQNWPDYCAVDGQRVLGWADITRPQNPRLAHRGFLGMGVISEARAQGLGSKLLAAALQHAQQIGIEKIELSVYTDNLAAIHLYRKAGFAEIGVIHHYRKHKGRYFDCLEMELFF